MDISTKHQKLNKTSSRLRIAGIGCLIIILCSGLSVAIVFASGVLSGTKGNLDGMPMWSPDGNKIVFTSNRNGNFDIYTMNVDGSNVRQLTKDPFAKLYSVQSPTDRQPAWSPDGEQIVFVSGRDNQMWSFTEMSIYVMGVDGSDPIQLTNPGSVAGLGLEKSPVWSPDGSSIAFVHDSYNKSDIFVMKPDGSSVIQLTSYQAYTFDWSPDGEQIMFASQQNSEGDIYVMNADGSNIVRLTNEGLNIDKISWSPNGDLVAFASNRDGDWEIYVMNTDGSNIVQLTDNQSDDQWPDWSPDNMHIVYASDRDGDWDIYIFDLGGGNLSQITGK